MSYIAPSTRDFTEDPYEKMRDAMPSEAASFDFSTMTTVVLSSGNIANYPGLTSAYYGKYITTDQSAEFTNLRLVRPPAVVYAYNKNKSKVTALFTGLDEYPYSVFEHPVRFTHLIFNVNPGTLSTSHAYMAKR